MRGAAVAVEGDNPQAVETVVRFLENELHRCGDFFVKIAEGPEAPEEGQEVTLRDFRDLTLIWDGKGQEIATFITTTPEADEEDHEGSKHEGSIPIIIMNRYSHYATIQWASRLPAKGKYDLKDHWLWFATLWRDIISPDITIYVRDTGSDKATKHKTVELVEDLRLILVQREKGIGQAQWKVDDSTLRRLGFEVTEWIRSVCHRGDGMPLNGSGT